MECKNCGIPITRKLTKKQLSNSETRNFFCNSSCAATWNNKTSPKRSPENYCFNCTKPITSSRTYCKSCYSVMTSVDGFENLTYNQVTGSTDYQKNSRIRYYARKLYKSSSKPKVCQNCGYAKHFEVCHIKAIKDFPAYSLIKEINNLDNLVALCPNCHWELDSGLLEVATLIGVEPT